MRQEANITFEQLCSHCIDCKVRETGRRLSIFQVFCWCGGWVKRGGGGEKGGGGQEANTDFEQLCVNCKVGASGLLLTTFHMFCYNGERGAGGGVGGCTSLLIASWGCSCHFGGGGHCSLFILHCIALHLTAYCTALYSS